MHRNRELSAAYARLVLHSGVAPAAELLRGVGVSEEALADAEFIDAVALAVLFRNYARCVPDRGWTARLGAQFSMAAHGPLGFAALSAPTLGEALDVMGSLYECRSTAFTASTCATATRYVLSFEDVTGIGDFACWLAEVVLKIVEVLLATILAHPVGRNVEIRLQHAAPPGSKHLLAGYDASVLFAAGENSIAVPLAWRQLPSPLSDETVYRANVVRCRELIAARAQAGSIAAAVRNRLCHHFDTQMLRTTAPCPPPTLEQIAGALHMTSRTLIRRLQREQTAYHDLLEELRRDYAERLLRDARLQVADVAEMLGYREAANFNRAFRRWYGTTPALWRRQ